MCVARRFSLTLPRATGDAVGGEGDAMLDSADTRRRLEANAPRATVDFLPGAGHLIRDQAGRVLDFLVRAESSSA